MGLRLMAFAIAAAVAVPGPAWCAGSTGSSSKRTIAAAGDRPYGSRPAPSRPRNPVDRSASDPGAGTFKAFDVNNDGYISRDEAKESGELNRRFTALDKDGDGKLSMTEVTGWRSASYAGRTSEHRVGITKTDDGSAGLIPPTPPVRSVSPPGAK